MLCSDDQARHEVVGLGSALLGCQASSGSLDIQATCLA